MTPRPAGVEGPAGKRCPRCAGLRSPLPPVRVHALEAEVSRCLRCGARYVHDHLATKWVFSCETCGVAFLADELLPHDSRRCPACHDGRAIANLPEAELAAASESEVRAALRTRWRFVGADGLSEYLDRLAAQTARHVAGAPAAARVALVDEGSFRTLALPSGTLLVSLGALESLENEAELAFLLGHELGHAASSDALARLVRLGFDSVRREDGADGNAVWALAVEDLLRVGYGRRRERDADERAIEAMLSAGYDPAAARRLLQRLDERMHAGDARLAELAGSHPAPEERVRRIERMLHGRLRGDEPFRLNREVFRRVVGHDPASRPLGIVPLDPTELEPAGEIRGGVPGWLVKAAGVGLLAALILLLALLLSR